MGVPPVPPVSGAEGDLPTLLGLAIAAAVAVAGWLVTRRIGARQRPSATGPLASGEPLDEMPRSPVGARP